MRLFLALFLIMTSTQAVAAPICGELFSRFTDAERSEHAQLYVEKRALEAEIHSLMMATGHTQNQLVQNMRMRRLAFDFALRVKADPLVALNIYRPMYETYKIALSELIKYSQSDVFSRDEVLLRNARFMVQALTQDGMFKDLQDKVEKIIQEPNPSVEQILDVYDHVVARTRDEYKYIEWFIKSLEDSPQITENLMNDLIYIRKNLASESVNERFPSLEVLSDKTVEFVGPEVIKDRPQILVYWLQSVRDAQRQSHRSLFVRSIFHVKTLQDLVYRFVPEQFRVPISKFIGMDYNVYVLKVPLEDIMAVINAPNLESRIDVLKEVAPQRKNMEQFFETFARLAPEMDVWIELKNHMGAKKAEPTYGEFHRMMVEAEGHIKTLGYISKLSVPSQFDNYVGWVLPVGAVGVGTAVATHSTWWPYLENLIQQLPF